MKAKTSAIWQHFDDFSLELGMELPAASDASISSKTTTNVAENDELTKRLAALRQA